MPTDPSAALLVPLPDQPADVPWPGDDWPRGPLPDAVAESVTEVVDELFTDTDRYGRTYAVLLVVGGRLVLERYAGSLRRTEGDSTPVGPDTPLRSWSMAKSVLHAAVGVLVGEGRLDPTAPAAVPAWHEDPDDPRAAITLEHLLTMRDGLAFQEDYVPGTPSDVIEMIFGSGAADVAAYAAARPLAHPPGTVFNYSSGTSNLVARIAGDIVGGGRTGMEDFLGRRVFDPIGMRSARPGFDEAGTFVGSSYVTATAADFARFGLLYLRGGVWEGHAVLPAGWVDHARRLRSVDPETGRGYGAHWWVVRDDPHGSFWANGFQGQSIMCVPGLDLVAVRLGRTPLERTPNLPGWRDRLRGAFAPTMRA